MRRFAGPRVGWRMNKLSIRARLDYRVATPTDLLIQLEAAAIPEQAIETTSLDLDGSDYVARVPAHDTIGERIWLSVRERLTIDYRATVVVDRIVADCRSLAKVPLHQLPGETVQYLFPSRYCPSDQFETFAASEFGAIEGGAQAVAIRDWVGRNFSYVSGASTSATTAIESFVTREGICRDYAHMLITLARAAGIPARIASVYAPKVNPPDFHAVAEVFLGGEWHLLDATGMAEEGAMAKIGIGRDAADVAFLTAFGKADLVAQEVSVALV